MKKEIKQLSFVFILMIIMIGFVGLVMGEDEKYYDTRTNHPVENANPNDPNVKPMDSGWNDAKNIDPKFTYDPATGNLKDTSCGCQIEPGFGSSFSNFKVGSCGESSDSGSEKEEGKGTLTPKMDAAVMAVVGLVQSLASILSPVKDVLSNGQGSTTSNTGASSTDLGLSGGAQAGYANTQTATNAAADGACDYKTKNICENVTTKVCEDAVANETNSTNCKQETHEECRDQQVCVLSKNQAVPGQTIGSVLGSTATISGNAVAGSEQDNTGGLIGIKLSQNNLGAQTTTSIQKMGTLLASSVNLKVNVREQIDVYTPDQKKTDILLEGASGSPNSYSETPEKTLSSKSSVTGNVIAPTGNNQFVSLVKHDLGMSGEQIGVETFKSFDNVNANGAVLDLKDGDTLIEFNKQKTYYSREIKQTPYFMNKIVNENDDGTYFRLREGGSEGSFLVDNLKRTTIGDDVIAHPDVNMKGIVIAKERQAMFERGLMAKKKI